MTSDIQIGRYGLTRIEEMLTPGFDPAFLFPRYRPEILGDHRDLTHPDFFDAPSGKVMSSMHSWLIRHGEHVILVDTGCGNDKVRTEPAFARFHKLQQPFLERLALAGVAPEDVTMVVNTHLHIDHIGWNTRLEGGEWVPTFPNARYIASRIEMDHWTRPDGGLAHMPDGDAIIADSVTPIVEAGLFDLVEDGDTLAPGIIVDLAPGHTPGQIFVRVEDDGAAAIFTGDCIHQPMQIYEPDWNSRFCEDQHGAVATRRRLLDYCADAGALLAPAHFGHPHAGYVRRAGNGFSFHPLAR